MKKTTFILSLMLVFAPRGFSQTAANRSDCGVGYFYDSASDTCVKDRLATKAPEPEPVEAYTVFTREESDETTETGGAGTETPENLNASVGDRGI